MNTLASKRRRFGLLLAVSLSALAASSWLQAVPISINQSFSVPLDGGSASTGIFIDPTTLGADTLVSDVNVTINFGLRDRQGGYTYRPNPFASPVFVPYGDGYTSPQDLLFYLRSPLGTIVNLVLPDRFSSPFVGTGGSLTASLTLDDEAILAPGGTLSSGSSDHQPAGFLGAFDDEQAAGQWVLFAQDTRRNEDFLFMSGWNLDLTTYAPALPSQSVPSGGSTLPMLGASVLGLFVSRRGLRGRGRA